MRIDHVTPHFLPDVGGVESHVHQLARYLLSRGHEVVVHTSQHSPRRTRLPPAEVIDGITVRRYRNAVRLGYYATVFRPEIRGADLVHLHGYGHWSNDWSARRASGSFPVVYSLHHGLANPSPTPMAAFRRDVYDRLIGFPTLRKSNLLVAASQVDVEWLDQRDFEHPRVEVIPTGLEAAAFELGDAERGHTRANVESYVLFVGRLHREKSIDDLLRAFASLAAKNLGLVIVGPDAGVRHSLESIAHDLHVADRVRFLGEVDERTKRDLLAGCEVLVLPSFYESQGIVILEAWAQGRPVIASRVGGVPYLVREGEDGLTYRWGYVRELSEILASLLADPGRAARIGRAGQVRVRNEFAWEAIAPRFLTWYETLFEEHKS